MNRMLSGAFPSGTFPSGVHTSARIALAVLLAAFAVQGCGIGINIPLNRTKSASSDTQVPNAAIAHIVLVWLKEPGNAEHRAKLIATSKEFAAIPGVLGVRAGEPIPSERKVVDDSFDVGIVMYFADDAALQAYEVHPAHKRAAAEVLAPLTSRFTVYDIRLAD